MHKCLVYEAAGFFFDLRLSLHKTTNYSTARDSVPTAMLAILAVKVSYTFHTYILHTYTKSPTGEAWNAVMQVFFTKYFSSM